MSSFLSQLDHQRIELAIAQAEQKTSGEIRVVIHPRAAPVPLDTARDEFARLGMHLTRRRNAVLLLVAPSSHTFAIYGDTAIHEKCGEPFWRDVAAAIGDRFKQADFTGGIVEAVTRAGILLATHFPRTADDRNELPDSVVDGPRPVI